MVAAPRDSAPHGTCPICGWSGYDWAFRHQPHCTKCYQEERPERARDRERVNAEKRLMRTAQAQVPHSVLHRAADRIPLLAGALIAGGLIAHYVFDLHFGIEDRYLLVAWSVGLLVLLVLADRVSDGELSKRFVLVRARLTRLVEERNRRIDEADAVHTSPKWRLLRDAIVKEQGREAE